MAWPAGAVEIGTNEGSHVHALAELFCQAFDEASVDLDADFFELGGDSLIAEALVTAIEERFGTILPVSILLESPTPRRLSQALISASTKQVVPALEAIRGHGSGSPLFCVHGMDGYSAFPRKLGAGLDLSRPIFALRARGFLPGEAPLATVPAMAAEFLKEVRAVRPNGPYVIFGQCGSSFVAFEMAQQLTAAGETVTGLVLVDPLHADLVFGGELIPWVRNRGVALALLQARADQQAQLIVAEALESPEIDGAGRRQLMGRIVRAAIAAYAPTPYPGRTLLIVAGGRTSQTLDREFGMPRLLPNMRSVVIGDDHASVFTTYVSQTIAAVRSFIDEVSPSQ